MNGLDGFISSTTPFLASCSRPMRVLVEGTATMRTTMETITMASMNTIVGKTTSATTTSPGKPSSHRVR